MVEQSLDKRMVVGSNPVMGILNMSRNKQTQHPFHLVRTSPWPILISFSLLNLLITTVLYFHEYNLNSTWFILLQPVGIFLFFYAFINWLWDVIIEATFEGKHSSAVQHGLRLGFIFFILSEIMFFFGFFWAFFHSSVSPSIWIGCVFPPLGIPVINPWGLPLINTVILLSSGVTVTWAHKVIVSNKVRLWKFKIIKSFRYYNARKEGFKGLFITIILGMFFTAIQLYEYKHAGFGINDSIYGAVFFLLTGFHGLHVLIGTIFLLVCLIRHIKYHFSRQHHIGLEMAIWYWHFVDVVWIFLFIFIYVWGA